MSAKSDFPFRAAGGMDKVLIDYFDRIGKPIANVAPLAASPSNAQISTAFNSLIAAMISDGKMVDS